MKIQILILILLLAGVVAEETLQPAQVTVSCATPEDARQIRTVLEMTSRRLDLLLERDILSGETLKNETGLLKSEMSTIISKADAEQQLKYDQIIHKINSEKWLLFALLMFTVTVTIWVWYKLMGKQIQKAATISQYEVIKKKKAITDKLRKGKSSKGQSNGNPSHTVRPAASTPEKKGGNA